MVMENTREMELSSESSSLQVSVTIVLEKRDCMANFGLDIQLTFNLSTIWSDFFGKSSSNRSVRNCRVMFSPSLTRAQRTKEGISRWSNLFPDLSSYPFEYQQARLWFPRFSSWVNENHGFGDCSPDFLEYLFSTIFPSFFHLFCGTESHLPFCCHYFRLAGYRLNSGDTDCLPLLSEILRTPILARPPKEFLTYSDETAALTPSQHSLTFCAGSALFFENSTGFFANVSTFEDAIPVVEFFERLLPFFNRPIRTAIIQQYSTLELSLEDPRFTHPSCLRVLRFLFNISIGFDQERQFSKLYMVGIAHFVMEYNRDAGFAELRVLVTSSDLGQHLIIWLEPQLEILMSTAHSEDIPTVVDVITLLVAKQKISPAAIVERVDFSPILCHLFSVIKPVVDRKLIALVIERICQSPVKILFLLKALDAFGPDLFADPAAVVLDAALFWNDDRFELFCSLVERLETRDLVLKAVNQRVLELPCNAVCAIWQLANIGSEEIPRIYDFTEELILRIDSARLVPTLFRYRFLKVRDLEVLLELAPLDASFLFYLRKFCTEAQILAAKSAILETGNPELLNLSFQLTRDHEFLLRGAVIAPVEFQDLIEREITENGIKFLEIANQRLNSSDGSQFAKSLALFDFSGIQEKSPANRLSVVRSEFAPFDLTWVYRPEFLSRLRFAKLSLATLTKIFAISKRSFEKLVRTADIDSDILIEIFQSTRNYRIVERLAKIGHPFSNDDIEQTLYQLHSEKSLIKTIGNFPDTEFWLTFFTESRFPSIFRTPPVLSAIFDKLQNHSDIILTFLENQEVVESASKPAVFGPFCGIFELVASALVRLKDSGNPKIVDFFIRLLYSRERAIEFPYTAVSRNWSNAKDAFEFILTQLSPEIVRDFTVIYSTDTAMLKSSVLTVNNGDIEEELALYGTPLILPVYLTISMPLRGNYVVNTIRYGTARYNFVGGLDTEEILQNTTRLPVVFAIFRRADVVCNEVDKSSNLPILIAPSICYCLSELFYDISCFKIVFILWNKFSSLKMLELMKMNQDFAKEFFFNRLNFLSDSTQWDLGREVLIELGRLYPNQTTLSQLILAEMNDPQKVEIAFEFASEVPLPNPIEFIRAILLAKLENRIDSFENKLHKILKETDSHADLIIEFPRLTRFFCHDRLFLKLFLRNDSTMRKELLQTCPPDILLEILAANPDPRFILQAASHFPTSPEYSELHYLVQPIPELITTLDWIAPNLGHQNPLVRSHSKEIIRTLFPNEAPSEVFSQITLLLKHSPFPLELLEFASLFPNVYHDSALQTEIINLIVFQSPSTHRQIFEIAKRFPPIPSRELDILLNRITHVSPILPYHVRYVCFFVYNCSSSQSAHSSTIFLALFSRVSTHPHASTEWESLFQDLFEVTTPENVMVRFRNLVKLGLPHSEGFIRWLAHLKDCIDFSSSNRFIIPAVIVIQVSRNSSLLYKALMIANPILKRAVRDEFTRPDDDVRDLFFYPVDSMKSALFITAKLTSECQVALLKYIRYLSYLMTPMLANWLQYLGTTRTLRHLYEILTGLKARREFAKFVTEIVREALASPQITPPEMVKRRIDVWVAGYSMVLEKPVGFAVAEKHLQFAMGLSGCQKVRYPTGSFWFQILNRLLDWNNVEFINEYFVTIMNNGVTVVDKDDLVNFIHEFERDDTLSAKLQVLEIIVEKLKGTVVLQEVAKAVFEYIEPFLDGEENGLLLDAFLEAIPES
jgi:hypothetical protein